MKIKQKFEIGKNAFGWYVRYLAYEMAGDRRLINHQDYTGLKTKAEAHAIRRSIRNDCM